MNYREVTSEDSVQEVKLQITCVKVQEQVGETDLQSGCQQVRQRGRNVKR